MRLSVALLLVVLIIKRVFPLKCKFRSLKQLLHFNGNSLRYAYDKHCQSSKMRYHSLVFKNREVHMVTVLKLKKYIDLAWYKIAF